ncbi:bifunctional 3-(3-hydroxy-phenyl)propionate/3-hydroxycinnamic acid hydroxylase [Streptomyces sp. NPDC047081]|uniref:bifunctional 3-(3-hydroxy-phenyl)propionate/3-hydroxycinnamic acid hydroxylase n=1 Tax=Streptomyces sp. NPDC047081 TaxID=3154706 RepID=UPI003406C0C9
MTSHTSTVAIVGYGPVGAAIANVLARRGIDVAVIEEHENVYPTPRAGGLVPESMRLLQIMRLADELVTDMLPFTFWYDIVDKDGNLVLSRQPDVPETHQAWGPNYSILQPLVETAIRRENTALGVSEFLGQRMTSLRQDAAGVDLVLTSADGSGTTTTLHADWVIGADGSRSAVRQAIDCTVEDHGGDESWLLVHLRVTDDSVSLPERLTQYANPERPVSYITPLPTNIKLFEFRVMPGDDPEELTSHAKVWELLSPWLKEGQAELIRVVVYTFHSRTATGWRDGRVLLAGDAAHLMTPDLGEGLNSGWRDAANLCWKLAGVVDGVLTEEVLDTYETERRPHVRAFTLMALALAKATTTIAEDPDGYRATLTLDSVFTHPRPLVGPGLHGEADLPAGLVAEQPVLADGSRLDDVIGYRFAIVGDLALLTEGVRRDPKVWGALDTQFVPDDDPAVRAWLDRLGTRAVVVRPDRLILGVAESAEDIAGIAEKLRRFVSADALGSAPSADGPAPQLERS